ncbi:MAG: hypothetical protein K2X81_11490, partial [Candidatus Obscuribacterales bacterium]|nr:hypothetical protein [Candidatus Obscuribacterales bacterium]
MKALSINWVVLGSLWLSAIVLGLPMLMKYENTPGAAANPPVQWGSNSQIRLSPDRPTLVMLAHPHCPCTRASIAELAKLMTKHQSKLNAYVLFLSPNASGTDWQKTDLWRSAELIPGVTVLSDTNGIEAKQLNSTTSGQTLVYSPQGQLLFSGGITAARGQTGDNFGLNSLISTLDTQSTKPRKAPVFGCPMVNPSP